MPQAASDFDRQAMSHLPGEHDDLSAMMAFVGDKIAEDVSDIEGKVSPYIGRRGRDASALDTAKFEQFKDSVTAQPEGSDEFVRFDHVPVDALRDRNTVGKPESLDPHAPGILNVTGDHPHRATRCSWHLGFPQRCGQMLDQKDRDAVIGFPYVKDRVVQIEWRRHKRHDYKPHFDHTCGVRTIK